MTSNETRNKNQEAFNKMVEHLKQMPTRATSPDGLCQYLTSDGNRCPVGALLTLEEALAAPVGSSYMLCSMPKKFPSLIGVDEDMLDEVQKLHDTPLSWKANKFISWDQMRKIGVKYNLNTDAIPPKGELA